MSSKFDISYDHLDGVGTAFYKEGSSVSDDEATCEIQRVYPGMKVKISEHVFPSTYGNLKNDGYFSFTLSDEQKRSES